MHFSELVSYTIYYQDSGTSQASVPREDHHQHILYYNELFDTVISLWEVTEVRTTISGPTRMQTHCVDACTYVYLRMHAYVSLLI